MKILVPRMYLMKVWIYRQTKVPNSYLKIVCCTLRQIYSKQYGDCISTCKKDTSTNKSSYTEVYRLVKLYTMNFFENTR